MKIKIVPNQSNGLVQTTNKPVATSVKKSDTEMPVWITVQNYAALAWTYMDVIDEDSGEVFTFQVAATPNSNMTPEGHKSVMVERNYMKLVRGEFSTDNVTMEAEFEIPVMN